MQALALAIGPAGIDYLASQLVIPQMRKQLATLKPPDRTITIPSFRVGARHTYENISVTLSKGALENFTPSFQPPISQDDGIFSLTLVARDFTATYAWHEQYDDYDCVYLTGELICAWDRNQKQDFPYRARFGSLNVVVKLGFKYNERAHTYDVVVVGPPTVTVDKPQPNVPGNSILQSQDWACFTSHVSDATAHSVSAVDFPALVKNIFPALIESIAASGHLTDDITYDFSVGDSGLDFPRGSGLAIGVTGDVHYKGTRYPGSPPADFPVPPPPPATAAHHVQIYVSSYELDALYWAFLQAGRLTVTVQASDLPDPEVLHCKTYAPTIKAFRPYSAFAMKAEVIPKQAPTISCQKVWVLTKEAMEILQNQLPSNIYQQLEGLAGNAYASQTALERELRDATINPQYWPAIENAAYAAGLVLTQDLQFVLTILSGEERQPNMVFDLARTDILEDLGLSDPAKSGSAAQTLTFKFVHADYAATFVSSTVPGFDGHDFGSVIWPVAGEPRYDEELAKVGYVGAPLPIMAAFHFLLDGAELSIQEGFVSVLAKVRYTGL